MGRTTLLALAACLLAAAGPTRAVPPFPTPLPKAVEQADFVGIVRVAEVPTRPRAGFRADAPPLVAAKPVSVLKGDPGGRLRILWQTHCHSCYVRDPKTVEVIPPAVGDEYLVFLAKAPDGAFVRFGYEWHFHKMPPAPNVRTPPTADAWRAHAEVSPGVAGLGEAVKYRFTATRMTAEPWAGDQPNMTAEDVDVVDLARKQVLTVKKAGVRKRVPLVVEKGETYAHEIDLTEAFGITRPGEYWVFRGGASEDDGPLRFEVTDKLRKVGGGR